MEQQVVRRLQVEALLDLGVRRRQRHRQHHQHHQHLRHMHPARRQSLVSSLSLSLTLPSYNHRPTCLTRASGGKQTNAPSTPRRAPFASAPSRARTSHTQTPKPNEIYIHTHKRTPTYTHPRTQTEIRMEIDAEQQRAMNMTVLRRLDGAIFNIMAQSSHVSLYSFDEDTKSWVRPDPLDAALLHLEHQSVSNGLDQHQSTSININQHQSTSINIDIYPATRRGRGSAVHRRAVRASSLLRSLTSRIPANQHVDTRSYQTWLSLLSIRDPESPGHRQHRELDHQLAQVRTDARSSPQTLMLASCSYSRS